MSDWTKKEVWLKRGDSTFNVEVVKVEREERNSWFIYAFIFKGNKYFDEIKEDFSLSAISDELHNQMHGGCTLNTWYYDATGNVISKKIGCDYCHLGDDRYESKYNDCTNLVLADAQRLFEFLSKSQN